MNSYNLKEFLKRASVIKKSILNKDSRDFFCLLCEYLSLTPTGNISHDSFFRIESKTIFFKLIHSNDKYRVLEFEIAKYESLVLINNCFMKDSINYQLNNNNYFSNFNDVSKVYLKLLFEGGFSKVFTFRNSNYFYVELSFDDNRLKKRKYFSFLSFIKYHFLKIKPDKYDEFRYISYLCKK